MQDRTLRVLANENAELKEKLAAAEKRIQELEAQLAGKATAADEPEAEKVQDQE